EALQGALMAGAAIAVAAAALAAAGGPGAALATLAAERPDLLDISANSSERFCLTAGSLRTSSHS
ncbi:hypothetical protein, partial [Flavihumibacter cheonanensis]|uniref:hypothetical protein n=1 Tax=Flavihumibacter cheonanensis TaxID=1442385 RepID=UPI001EF90B82